MQSTSSSTVTPVEGRTESSTWFAFGYIHSYSSEYSITSIDHKFMISGNSFYLMTEISDKSSSLEKRHSTSLYLEIGNTFSFTLVKNPFHVYRMKREDFVPLKPLKDEIVNHKTNTHGVKVEWLKIHWISVGIGKPLQFQYRYSNNSLECWKTVNLKRKTKGRLVDMGRIELPLLYDRPRAINPKKVSDLL